MSLPESYKKAGRPKKDPPTPINTADASGDRIEKYTLSILEILTTPGPFFKYFEHIGEDQQACLAQELAHELAFFPALNGLVTGTSTGIRGPRPKTAQALFMTQVRHVLVVHGVDIPIWKNNRDACTDLVDFCMMLARATDTRGVLISWRTVERAPESGFQGGN